MVIINGKELAGRRELILRNKVDRFIKLNRRRPSLLAIELSDDSGSQLYLKLKQAAAKRIGIEMKVLKRPGLASQGQALTNTDAIFIHHPPRQKLQEIMAQHLGGQAELSKEKIDEFWQKLADQIPPQKDVDCLTTENLQLVKQGKPRFLPATVKAVLYCLENAFNPPSSRAKSRDLGDSSAPPSTRSARSGSARNDGLKYVILGRSPILGLPLYWHLKNLDADVALLHSQSTVNDLRLAISEADVIISSVGKPGIITGNMTKPGVIAIDCGSPVGDMDFDSVSQKAVAITPVPGGVGPLTVVSLMENVVESAYHTSRESS